MASDYTIPPYCNVIEVNVTCSRQSTFTIAGEDAEKIAEHIDKPMTFSKDECEITLEKQGADIVGTVRITNPAKKCHEFVPKCLNGLPLCVHFWDTIVKITLDCPYHQDKEQVQNNPTWLCLDLGNTRTCALLDLPDKEIAFYNVEFTPLVSKDTPTGIIESLCAAVCHQEEEKHSFVTFGEDALAHKRRNTEKRKKTRSLFSSPKRHFWDNDRDQYIQKLDGNKFAKFTHSDSKGFEKALLGNEDNCSPRHIFQCSIIEILEQANSTLQAMGKDGEKKLKDLYLDLDANKLDAEHIEEIIRQQDNFAGITRLVFTYPAAWTVHERTEYDRVIQETCALYNSKEVNGCRFFLATKSCDEATAVLMYYLKTELDKRTASQRNARHNPMTSWIYEHGKAYQDTDGKAGMRCRIGVIDIGGGTSDLTIAEMKTEDDETRTRINVRSLYSSGTKEAGDRLLQIIIRDMLLEMVTVSLIDKDSRISPEDACNELREQVKNNDDLKKIARSFWFKLSIQAITAMEANKGDVITIKSEDKDWKDISEGYQDIVERLQETAMSESFISEAPSEKIELKFPTDWKKRYTKAIEEAFADTAALFSSALLVHDCDLLLFSGKTMENRSVQEFFKKYLAITCMPLKKTKEATAIGAEYYARRNENAMGFGIELKDYRDQKDENFYWDIPVSSIFRNAETCFPLGEEITFPVNQKEMVIYRKKFASDDMAFRTPSYQLRCNHEVKTDECYDVTLKYQDQDKELKLVSVRKMKGEDCSKDWTLRLYMRDEDSRSWLDSGNILQKEIEK